MNHCLSTIDLGDRRPLKRAAPQLSIIAQNAVHSGWHVEQLSKAVDVAHANYHEQHPVQTCLTVVPLVSIPETSYFNANIIPTLEI